MAVITAPLTHSTLPVRPAGAAMATPRTPKLFGRFFHRRTRQPTLYHRCLAVHMATAGTLSALR